MADYQVKIIRGEASPDLSTHFANLIIMSAEYFTWLWGRDIKSTLERMYMKPANLFSHEFVDVLVCDNEVAGMLLGYTDQDKRRCDLRTGWLFFSANPVGMLTRGRVLMKFNRTVGSLPENSFYISNVAVYPHFRRRGFGRMLMQHAQERAYKNNVKTLVLDVEADNNSAIGLYKSLGYRVEQEFVLPYSQGKELRFLRMTKAL